MNKTRQIILIAMILVIAIVLVSLSFAGNNEKDNNNETAETEGGIPTHEVFYSPPITDINGPFTIEYIYTKNGVDYIKIIDSSPQGRMNAMHWLRERGIDPTNLDIQFDDFVNPLKGEEN